MPRIPALLGGCALVGVIACATAWTWLHLTDARSLTAGAVIVCTVVSVAVALAVEAALKQIRRRGRPRRTHARPATTNPRKDTTAA